ncbi:hypothetical protein Agub_g2191 [Astrephomene gubernaculifera]|uniref:Uncharacterized protein n=1 Tax=Astrephomene gubernaculifera TaxID=47775 RepID=A0AAD3DJG2_9CHLO|nr:hypothetical protein Agub_g2191 [Astrephomene gubernaculifera]
MSFVSAGDTAAGMLVRAMIPSARQAAWGRLSLQLRHCSSSSSSGTGGDAPAKSGTFWSNLQRALFPVGPSKSAARTASEASASSSTPVASASRGTPTTQLRPPSGNPATAAAAAAAREARAQQRRAARGQEDAFAALSKPAEQFSGTLLKAAVLLITVPLGVHMMSHSLMMSLCVRGLESDRPETVVLTLKRVRSVVASDYLADRFEAEDGVGLLLATFHEGSGEAVLREFLAAAQQLLRFRSTREALLMSSLVERLQRAAAAGWLPASLREEAHQLYLEAHAARRMEMEAAAGVAAP